MQYQADSILCLARIRDTEFMAEAAQIRLARQAYGSGSTVGAAVAAARQIGTTLVHFSGRLVGTGCAPRQARQEAQPRWWANRSQSLPTPAGSAH